MAPVVAAALLTAGSSLYASEQQRKAIRAQQRDLRRAAEVERSRAADAAALRNMQQNQQVAPMETAQSQLNAMAQTAAQTPNPGALPNMPALGGVDPNAFASLFGDTQTLNQLIAYYYSLQNQRR